MNEETFEALEAVIKGTKTLLGEISYQK